MNSFKRAKDFALLLLQTRALYTDTH